MASSPFRAPLESPDNHTIFIQAQVKLKKMGVKTAPLAISPAPHGPNAGLAPGLLASLTVP